MTELEALQICRELWYWLYLNPCASKYKWPGWKEYLPMACACPCCEYRNQQTSKGAETNGNSCNICPLLGYAWQAVGNTYCTHDLESFYHRTIRRTRRGATGMVVAIDEAIRDLRKEVKRCERMGNRS